MTKPEQWWQMLASIIEDLEAADIDYMLAGSSALYAQKIAVPVPSSLKILIQWDLFPRALTLFQPIDYQETDEQSATAVFVRQGIEISMRCYYNTVIVTDPERVAIEHAEHQIWVRSLRARLDEMPVDDKRRKAIKSYWQSLQAHNSGLNERAWNQGAYDAWVKRFGTPTEAAQRIKRDPAARLTPLNKHIGDPTNKRIINLMGSHGGKAVALALLGADVTVVDLSQENARYAQEVAKAADVTIQYMVADVLHMPEAVLRKGYDLVIMELGILHYFVDLEPLASVIARLLQPGGRLILQDFHPVTAKLITSKGKKHRVEGNYFDQSITETEVAFSKHLSGDEQDRTQKVYLRKWTLGEIVTAIAQAGLYIFRLDEEPNMKRDDIGLPKTFTLVARKD